MFKKLFALLLASATLLSITACGADTEDSKPQQSSTGITGLEFFSAVKDGIDLEVGRTEKSYFTVAGTKDFSVEDDVVFVSSDESVCTFEYDSTALTTYVYFVVTAVGPGTATIHAETSDGVTVSENVTVTVTGDPVSDITDKPETEPGTAQTVATQMEDTYKIEEGSFDELNRREIRVTISPELEAEATDEDISEFLTWLANKQDDAHGFTKLYIYLFATDDDWSGGFTIAMCVYEPEGKSCDITIHTQAEREAFRMEG